MWEEIAISTANSNTIIVDGHKDIKILSKQMPGESVNLVKSFGVIGATPEVRKRLIWLFPT